MMLPSVILAPREIMDELVLVKHGRPRAHTGRWLKNGQWLVDVQQRADRDAMLVWARVKDEPFEPIPPMEKQEWSGPVLHVFARGVYKQVKSILP